MTDGVQVVEKQPARSEHLPKKTLDEVLPPFSRYQDKDLQPVQQVTQEAGEWIAVQDNARNLRNLSPDTNRNWWVRTNPDQSEPVVISEYQTLTKQAQALEESIHNGENPFTDNLRDASTLVGGLKRKLLPGFREAQTATVNEWLNERKREIAELRDKAKSDVQGAYQGSIETVETDVEKARLKTGDETESLPAQIKLVVAAVSEGREDLGALQTLEAKLPTGVDRDPRTSSSLGYQLKDIVREDIAVVQNEVRRVLTNGSQEGKRLRDLFYKSFGRELLSELIFLPPQTQIQVVELLSTTLKNLAKGYELEKAFERYAEEVDTLVSKMGERRMEYLRTLREMQGWVLATRAPKENAVQILKDGHLRSSREVFQATGVNPSHSTAGKVLGGLRYVSFGINGIDNVYGVAHEERKNSTGKREYLQNQGVTFLYDFEDVVEGDRPFYVVGMHKMNASASQSSFRQEVHAYPLDFDPNNPQRQEVALSIDKAIVLIPEVERETYEPVLADRTPEWRSEHVIYYPSSKSPQDYILEKRKARPVSHARFDEVTHYVTPFERDGKVVSVPVREQNPDHPEPLFLYKALDV